MDVAAILQTGAEHTLCLTKKGTLEVGILDLKGRVLMLKPETWKRKWEPKCPPSNCDYFEWEAAS